MALPNVDPTHAFNQESHRGSVSKLPETVFSIRIINSVRLSLCFHVHVSDPRNGAGHFGGLFFHINMDDTEN